MNTSILIVDDDRLTRETMSGALKEDYNIFTAGDGGNALEIIQKNNIDIVLSDLLMPGLNGIDLLKRVNAMDKKPAVILITGYATVESAVEAMKLGAYDYITKPINLDRLSVLIKKACETKRLREENVLLRKKMKEDYSIPNLIGQSLEMKKIIDVINQVSGTTATVLIEGESGTGKDIIANIIHYNSPRYHGPFIKVNCATFAESVLESEIFGHEKGSFTGAIATKKGRFELADGGTVFLDEIGDVPLSIQVKLLRFLQEKTFERVGGNRTFKVDVRIIAATNMNLERMVNDGGFREDLYYRLRVVKIKVPPLRERKKDIPALINFFLNKYSEVHNKTIRGISGDVMEIITAYDWPGNVRELMNCVESMVVMTKGDYITIAVLPDYLVYRCEELSGDVSQEGILANLEKQAIIDVLNKTGGNKTKAARLLGIGLRTLYRKIDILKL